MFHSDEPINDSDADRLHRKEFAIAFADALASYSEHDCLVVGLYGSWGSGKTSVLNMTQGRLSGRGDRVIVVEFHPWLVSQREALISEFFQQLGKTLGRQDSSASLRAIGQRLLRYGETLKALGTVPLPHVIPVGLAGVFLSTAGSLASQAGGPDKTLRDLKIELERDLAGQEAKIIVLLDDIDRLTSDEIQQVFQLVKAVADFPNVIYVLAMDPDVVAQALTQNHAPPDDDYLSKIVQVPVQVPVPAQADMEDLLLTAIRQLVPDLTSDNWGGYPYWQRLWFDGRLPRMFRTVREIKRFQNVLALEYGVLRGEVNAQDLVAITAVKVLAPHAYKEIYHRKDQLVDGLRNEDVLGSVTNGCPEELQDWVRRLLLQLFPPLSGQMQRATPRLGIADPRQFDKYFVLTVPAGQVSEARFNDIVSSSSLSLLETALNDLRSERALDSFLARLLDEAPRMQEDRAQLLVQALLRQGSDFAEMRGADGRGLVVLRLVYVLLSRLSSACRVNVLRETIESTLDVYTLAFNIAVLGQQHGKFEGGEGLSPGERSLSDAELGEVERTMVQKLGQLNVFEVENWPSLLMWWAEWDERSEREYVHSRVSPDDVPDRVQTFMKPYEGKEIPGLSASQWAKGLKALKKTFGEPWLSDKLREACSRSSGDHPLFDRVCESLGGSP